MWPAPERAKSKEPDLEVDFPLELASNGIDLPAHLSPLRETMRWQKNLPVFELSERRTILERVRVVESDRRDNPNTGRFEDEREVRDRLGPRAPW